MSNLPPINDHDFMRIVRKLVTATPPTPMTRIAFDLGVDVDDLCAWVMRYREPKRKAYISRHGAPIAPMTSADRQRLANHARAAEAAAEARRSIAILPRSERHRAERAEAE